MNAKEFNYYTKKPNEYFDFSEFDNTPVLNASKGPVWKIIEHCYHNNIPIFIVTARKKSMTIPIYNFLVSNGINIPMTNINCIGDFVEDAKDIPNLKKEILKKISKKYKSIIFFDDNKLTIKKLMGIKGIEPILV